MRAVFNPNFAIRNPQSQIFLLGRLALLTVPNPPAMSLQFQPVHLARACHPVRGLTVSYERNKDKEKN